MIPYEARFVETLRKRIIDDLTARHNELGGGSVIVPDDAAATGMRVARQVGVISGLKTALAHIEATQDEMSGRVDRKKEPR